MFAQLKNGAIALTAVIALGLPLKPASAEVVKAGITVDRDQTVVVRNDVLDEDAKHPLYLPQRYRPDFGQCALWYPGSAPTPSSCNTIIPVGAVLIFG